MRPSERVDLLRKLADRFEESDYLPEDVQLMLGEFGFSTSDPDYWDGTPRSYLLHHLRGGTDAGLVELDEHLNGVSSIGLLSPADLPWETGAVRLFLSHTSANARRAGELRDIFLRWRLDTFVAHTTIEPTREWQVVIETALASCHAMAALITPDFRESAWCDQELGYCIARNIPIVPVRLEADPHGFIGKYQAARPSPPGTAPWIADAIFRALAHHAAIRDLMAGPVVHRYAGSTNEDGARINFGLLLEIPPEAWTRELVEVAERATDSNEILRDATIIEPEAKPIQEAVAEFLAPHRERLGMNVSPPALDDDIPF